eukprot:CAMPEP_0118704442 /NCGR_PEP_ID=MMETSP0800-20121206/19240_1 /TAXON_ID=210618 ORGANISM="Striatella unipunctata, Strain CCMP2910" /NCGR_SAMPLE_ID=MMETSP0800 /ASSEMBLY_ACC=CAM_ASM_000638 /LENGTH=151 /DNA_ID=CAMNT_0006606337 /DNA_START=152 /DNA_END=607 /DNA_ORIENTATION=-
MAVTGRDKIMNVWENARIDGELVGGVVTRRRSAKGIVVSSSSSPPFVGTEGHELGTVSQELLETPPAPPAAPVLLVPERVPGTGTGISPDDAYALSQTLGNGLATIMAHFNSQLENGHDVGDAAGNSMPRAIWDALADMDFVHQKLSESSR